MPLRLLRTDEGAGLTFDLVIDEDLLSKDQEDDLPNDKHYRYAILSHRWREEEVTFADCTDPVKARSMAGWQKLDNFRTLARTNGYKHVWMDTCCIDKSSSTELAEALNSMYKWYQLADVCYAFLDDVHGHFESGEAPPPSMVLDDAEPFRGIDAHLDNPRALPTFRPLLPSEEKWAAFLGSEWFTRGWTLQEMIAPKLLVFYASDWNMISHCRDIASIVALASGVDNALLSGKRSLQSYSIAQRLSWAAWRQTTRVEDRAYSLFGILSVRIPIFYGEGSFAFHRLQEQLMLTTTDTTIFAWYGQTDSAKANGEAKLLASTIDDFKCSGFIAALPATSQQQRFQTLGSRLVRFDVYVFKRWLKPKEGIVLREMRDLELLKDKNVAELVIGCVDGVSQKLITLPVQREVATRGAFTISVKDGERLRTQDLWGARAMDHTTTLDIWRSRDDALHNGSMNNDTVVLIRAPDIEGLKITNVEPEEAWCKDQWYFVWPEGTDQDIMKGIISFQYRGNRAKLVVTKVAGQQSRIQFRPPGFAADWKTFALQCITWAPWFCLQLEAGVSLGPRPIAIYDTGVHFLKASSRVGVYLHREVDCIDLEATSHSDIVVSNLTWFPREVLRLFAAVVVAIPVLLLGLPSATILILRSRNSTLRTPSRYGIDMPIFLLLSVTAMFFAITVVATYVLLIDRRMVAGTAWSKAPIMHTMSTIYIVHRRWFFWIWNATCFGLCVQYLVLVHPHPHTLHGVDKGLEAEQGALWTVELRLFVATWSILFPRWRVDSLRFILSMAVAAPLILALIAMATVTVPYGNEDCLSGSITEESAQIYLQYSNITGWDVSSTCNHFASEGFLGWTIAVLTLLDGLLAFVAWLLLGSSWLGWDNGA